MDTSYPREDIFMTHPNKPDNSHTIVDIGSPTAPRDHLLWSLCNTVYLNLFCLGFMALVYSVKARDQKVHGNELAARRYGRKARCYNILATFWNIALPAFILALVITGIMHLSQVKTNIKSKMELLLETVGLFLAHRYKIILLLTLVLIEGEGPGKGQVNP